MADQPKSGRELTKKIDQALDTDHLKSLLNRNALAQETMSAERLFAVKEEMEKARSAPPATVFRPRVLSQSFGCAWRNRPRARSGSL